MSSIAQKVKNRPGCHPDVKQKVENAYRSFLDADTDKDGFITGSELKVLAQKLGFSEQQLLKCLDANQDGKISEDEFVLGLYSFVAAEIMGNFFKRADKDNSGYLSEAEVAACVEEYKKSGHQEVAAWCSGLMGKCDKNQDKKISWLEFQDYCIACIKEQLAKS